MLRVLGVQGEIVHLYVKGIFYTSLCVKNNSCVVLWINVLMPASL